jgi:hypothetical protein
MFLTRIYVLYAAVYQLKFLFELHNSAERIWELSGQLI